MCIRDSIKYDDDSDVNNGDNDGNNYKSSNKNLVSNSNNNKNFPIPVKNGNDAQLFKSNHYKRINSKTNLEKYLAYIRKNKRNKLRKSVNRKLKALSHRRIEKPPLNVIPDDLSKTVMLSYNNDIKIFPAKVSLSPEITKDILHTIIDVYKRQFSVLLIYLGIQLWFV